MTKLVHPLFESQSVGKGTRWIVIPNTKPDRLPFAIWRVNPDGTQEWAQDVPSLDRGKKVCGDKVALFQVFEGKK